MPRMSKKAKAENYDAVAAERDMMHLVLLDARAGRKPIDVAPSEDTHEGDVTLRAELWRPAGAHGGIVVHQTWTRDGRGVYPGTLTVERLDDMARRVPGWCAYTTVHGRLLERAVQELREHRSASLV